MRARPLAFTGPSWGDCGCVCPPEIGKWGGLSQLEGCSLDEGLGYAAVPPIDDWRVSELCPGPGAAPGLQLPA